MGKTIGIKQGLQGLLSLGVNVSWDELDGDAFQRTVVENPVEAGRQLTLFFKNGCRYSTSGQKTAIGANPFNPEKYIGKGWSIWRGPAEGDGHSGEEDQDMRSLALPEDELEAIRLETMLRSDEKHIGGEERQRRLKEAGLIRLDARVIQVLWKNQVLIPESWKQKTNGYTTFIYFDGTILRSPNGNRCVLYLYWDGGRWRWDYRWLGNDWDGGNPSAVLAS